MVRSEQLSLPDWALNKNTKKAEVQPVCELTHSQRAPEHSSGVTHKITSNTNTDAGHTYSWMQGEATKELHYFLNI